MTTLRLITLTLLVALVAFAATARADTVITISGNGASCGGSNCFGDVLTLTIHPTGGLNYQVTLQIDTSGATTPGNAIAAVNFKFDTAFTAATLKSFSNGVTTSNYPPATDPWTTDITNSLNANGCGTSVLTGFVCTEQANLVNLSGAASSVTPLAPQTGGPTYTWVWDATAEKPGLGQVHIGTLFGYIQTTSKETCGPHHTNCVTTDTYDFKQNGIISAAVTPIPEPASLALFGSGLIGLGAVVRKRHFGRS